MSTGGCDWLVTFIDMSVHGFPNGLPLRISPICMDLKATWLSDRHQDCACTLCVAFSNPKSSAEQCMISCSRDDQAASI